MVSSTRSIFLTALCLLLNIVRQFDCSESSADSGDEDKTLQEALLLLNIIKTGTTPHSPALLDLFATFHDSSMATPLAPKPPRNVLSHLDNALDPPIQNDQRQRLRRNYRRNMSNKRRRYDIRPFRRAADADNSGLLGEEPDSVEYYNNRHYRRNDFEGPFKPQPFASKDTETSARPAEANTKKEIDLTTASVATSETDAKIKTVTTNGTGVKTEKFTTIEDVGITEAVTENRSRATTTYADKYTALTSAAVFKVITKLNNTTNTIATNGTKITMAISPYPNLATKSINVTSYRKSINIRTNELPPYNISHSIPKRKSKEIRKRMNPRANKGTNKLVHYNLRDSKPRRKIRRDRLQKKLKANTGTNKQSNKKVIKKKLHQNATMNTGNLSNTGNSTYPGLSDPVQRQIKSELDHEIKGMRSVRNISYLTEFGYKRNNKTVETASSLRVHLKMSSTYPIPWPENHAFCYHHPKNGLCGIP